MQFMLMLFLYISVLTSVVLAHGGNGIDSNDLPESLIWLLSFFILIGVVLVVGSFYMFQDPVTESREGVTYFRIHPNDIRIIGNLLRKNQECDGAGRV